MHGALKFKGRIIFQINVLHNLMIQRTFALRLKMEVVAQLVRASACGAEGRGFEPHLPPQKDLSARQISLLFLWDFIYLPKIASCSN